MWAWYFVAQRVGGVSESRMAKIRRSAHLLLLFTILGLPTSTVELSSYELKRRADAGKLEAVYEAAAHGRWAHRTHLVLEVDSRESKVAPEIMKDAERFGLGVYKLWLGEDGRAFVQQMLASRVQTPDDADLDDMIGVVLDQLHTRDQKRYRQALK